MMRSFFLKLVKLREQKHSEALKVKRVTKKVGIRIIKHIFQSIKAYSHKSSAINTNRLIIEKRLSERLLQTAINALIKNKILVQKGTLTRVKLNHNLIKNSMQRWT